METITIKIEGRENMSFFVKLLQKFSFIKEVKVNTAKTTPNISEAPIEWAKDQPAITDFNGLWHDYDISLSEIREKGWKRS